MLAVLHKAIFLDLSMPKNTGLSPYYAIVIPTYLVAMIEHLFFFVPEEHWDHLLQLKISTRVQRNTYHYFSLIFPRVEALSP